MIKVNVGDYVCTNKEYHKYHGRHVSGKVVEVESTDSGLILNVETSNKTDIYPVRINISWFL